MQAFGEAFYGRSSAYDLAFGADDDALAQALSRNVLNGEHQESAKALAGYVRKTNAHLAALDDAAVRAGSWTFPKPMVASLGTAT